MHVVVENQLGEPRRHFAVDLAANARKSLDVDAAKGLQDVELLQQRLQPLPDLLFLRACKGHVSSHPEGLNVLLTHGGLGGDLVKDRLVAPLCGVDVDACRHVRVHPSACACMCAHARVRPNKRAASRQYKRAASRQYHSRASTRRTGVRARLTARQHRQLHACA